MMVHVLNNNRFGCFSSRILPSLPQLLPTYMLCGHIGVQPSKDMLYKTDVNNNI
jgi:hypothetical protein